MNPRTFRASRIFIGKGYVSPVTRITWNRDLLFPKRLKSEIYITFCDIHAYDLCSHMHLIVKDRISLFSNLTLISTLTVKLYLNDKINPKSMIPTNHTLVSEAIGSLCMIMGLALRVVKQPMLTEFCNTLSLSFVKYLPNFLHKLDGVPYSCFLTSLSSCQ